MAYICPYCGNETSGPTSVCCGEVHSEEARECPECGSLDVYMANIEVDGTGWFCSDCSHNWDNN